MGNPGVQCKRVDEFRGRNGALQAFGPSHVLKVQGFREVTSLHQTAAIAVRKPGHIPYCIGLISPDSSITTAYPSNCRGIRLSTSGVLFFTMTFKHDDPSSFIP